MKISVPNCDYIVILLLCFISIYRRGTAINAVNSSVKDVQFIEIAFISFNAEI